MPKSLAAAFATVAGILTALGVILRQPIAPGVPASSPAADPARLERDVRALSIRFAPRSAEDVGNLDRAAAYIAAEFKAAGAETSVQEFQFDEFDRNSRRARRGPFRNVVARFGPDAGERIVVGAHYDGYGPFPAADDNASGAAGLLELARLLGKDAPAAPTELVAYSTEEPPYFATADMGSARHARALKARGAVIRAMISLEMIGTFSDEPGSQAYPSPLLALYYPSRADFIAVVGDLRNAGLARRVKKAMRAGGLPVYSINAPAFIPGIDYSDHASYWREGYPAVMISDTAFYRNPRYHTSRDTADRLDYRRMAQVVSGAFAAVRDLAR